MCDKPNAVIVMMVGGGTIDLVIRMGAYHVHANMGNPIVISMIHLVMGHTKQRF